MPGCGDQPKTSFDTIKEKLSNLTQHIALNSLPILHLMESGQFSFKRMMECGIQSHMPPELCWIQKNDMRRRLLP